ncbi:hypothetical protein LLEC1_07681 [Akanthomyces lecanii]|uniref:Uncharacterized protein n=1 Tax=Cordyceps confragosa TaxID=2714763 RepID=A0A179I1K2_CORDF|nr:hypothetical protein LLEC1_07681 [Akanthomyces lecanii]
MTRQGKDTHSQSSPPNRPEQHRPSVSRLKAGETLQSIRRTAQDLYLFRDNVDGRSALVRDSNPIESQNDDEPPRRGKTKSPGHASHGEHRCLGSGESHHIKIHQRRRSGVEAQGEGSTTQHSHFRVSIDTTSPLVAAFCMLTSGSISVPTFLVIDVVKSTAQSGVLGRRVQGRSATSADLYMQSKKATGAAISRNQKTHESIVQDNLVQLAVGCRHTLLYSRPD